MDGGLTEVGIEEHQQVVVDARVPECLHPRGHRLALATCGRVRGHHRAGLAGDRGRLVGGSVVDDDDEVDPVHRTGSGDGCGDALFFVSRRDDRRDAYRAPGVRGHAQRMDKGLGHVGKVTDRSAAAIGNP